MTCSHELHYYKCLYFLHNMHIQKAKSILQFDINIILKVISVASISKLSELLAFELEFCNL